MVTTVVEGQAIVAASGSVVMTRSADPGDGAASGPTTPSRRVELFGIGVDPLTVDESVDRVDELIAAGGHHHHVCINAAKLARLGDDERLRSILARASMVSVDGQPVVWAARALGRPVPERVAGIDLMHRLLARAAERHWRVYLLGGTQEVVDAAAGRFEAEHPGLRLVGCRNGYWQPEDEADVVHAVAATRPDLVFVGLPTPRKEYFVETHLHDLGARVVVGVGGSFDVAAGLVSRAPQWMQDAGLEWFHRLAQEPRRMWKRYLTGNTRFVAMVASEWVKARRPRPGVVA